MDETQLISVEDQAVQDSSDVDDLGKAITGLRKSIQDFKKSSDDGFVLMKEQFSILLKSMSAITNSCEIPATNLGISRPPPASQRYDTTLKRRIVDFPLTSGDNPHIWLRKCERYFQYHSIRDEEWVNLAEIHLDDRARNWYTSWKLGKRFITWTIFCNELCKWFANQHSNEVVEKASQVEQPQVPFAKSACKVIDKMPQLILGEVKDDMTTRKAGFGQDGLKNEMHNVFKNVASRVPSSAVEDSCTHRVAENKTHNVIEELPHPNSINLDVIRGHENVIDENGNGVLNSPGLATLKLFEKEYFKPGVAENVVQQEVSVEIPKPISTTQHSFSMGYVVHNKEDVQLGSEIGQPSFLGMKSLEADYFLFDERPERIPLGQRDGRVIHEQGVFMFDPGGSSWNCKGCMASTSIATEIHELDVELWIGKIVMFVFDPGGSSWCHMVWCSMKKYVYKQDFGFRVGEHNVDSFCTNFRWKNCPNVATMLGLVSPNSVLTRFNAYKAI